MQVEPTSKEPLVPVTDSEKRSTLAAKLMLMDAGLPFANLSWPTTVSGAGRSSQALNAIADASTASPKPVTGLLSRGCLQSGLS